MTTADPRKGKDVTAKRCRASEHAAHLLHARHVPSGEVAVNRRCIRKQVGLGGRAGHVPVRDVGVERLGVSKRRPGNGKWSLTRQPRKQTVTRAANSWEIS